MVRPAPWPPLRTLESGVDRWSSTERQVNVGSWWVVRRESGRNPLLGRQASAWLSRVAARALPNRHRGSSRRKSLAAPQPWRWLGLEGA